MGLARSSKYTLQFPIMPPRSVCESVPALQPAQSVDQGTAGMKRSITRGFLRGAILLSLSARRVGCFIVCGAGPRSTAHQLRPSSRDVDRPWQQTQHPPSREAGDSVVGLEGQRMLVQRAKSGRTYCLRQVRCIWCLSCVASPTAT